MRRFLMLRAAGFVNRYHTVPFAPKNTLAEHCYQMLVLLFCAHPNPSMELIKAIMFHDAHEIDLGDVPAPLKRVAHINELFRRLEKEWNSQHQVVDEEDLSADDKLWLKTLDALEGALWCGDQVNLTGNALLETIQGRYMTYLNNAEIPAEIKELISQLSEMQENNDG